MAECEPWDVVCKGGELVGGAVDKAVDSGAQGLGEEMMGAWDSLMKGFLTSWLDSGMLVSLDGASMQWLIDQLQVISIFLATVGIMVACVWTMVHTRGDQAVKVSKALFMTFLVTTLGTAFMQVAVPAGDAFAKWILDEAGVTVSGYGAIGPTASVGSIGAGLAIIAGIFGAAATLLQWIIMIIRAVVLPVLIAFWPVAAAGAMIKGSEGGFATITKWLIAFLIYKPVAAIIYAFAWKLKSGGDGIGGVINGMLLLVLAVAALPAIMKLLGPATSAMGSAAGGTMAMAAGAAAVSAGVAGGAAIATGGGSAAAGAGAAGRASTASSTTSSGMSMAQGASVSSPSSGPSGSVLGGGGSAGPAGGMGASGPSGNSGPSGSAGTNGGAGTSGASAGGAVSSSSGQPSSGGLVAGGAPSPGASGSKAGIQAATQSLGGSVAQGAKDADGKGVLGS